MEKARAHKVPLESVSAWRAALATFAAFVVVGFVPLLVFIVHFFSPATVARPYVWSAGLTAATFFAVGAAKSDFVEQRWYAAGLETLLVGGSAAALAFGLGMLLKGVVQGRPALVPSPRNLRPCERTAESGLDPL